MASDSDSESRGDYTSPEVQICPWGAREKPKTNLRLIANIQAPSYLIVAARAETGITDLSQIRQKRWPVKILARGTGAMDEAVLSHYGLSRKAIEDAGGRVGSDLSDRKDLDSQLCESSPWNGGNS